MHIVKTIYEFGFGFYSKVVFFRKEEKHSNGSLHGYTWTVNTLGLDGVE